METSGQEPWLSCCPLTGLWDPFQMAFSWLIHGGDPNYLLSGMILQVRIFRVAKSAKRITDP